jgi:uncharacterized UPF0160 family protein
MFFLGVTTMTTVISTMSEMDKDENITTVITHDGKFHLDEVMACVMLLFTCNKIQIVRNRAEGEEFAKQNLEANDDIETILSQKIKLVDIGGLHIRNYAYDHHMRDFSEQRDGVKYSSAGLVWKEHSLQIIYNLVNSFKKGNSIFDPAYEEEDPELIEELTDYSLEIAKIIDDTIIKGIDAIDNGQTEQLDWDMDKHIPTLASVISSMVPFDLSNKDEVNIGFDTCMLFCGQFLNSSILNAYSNLKLEKKFLKSIPDDVIEGEILLLDYLNFKGFDWISFCQKYPEETSHIKLCVFCNGKDDWRVQTLPGDPDIPFSMKCPAPKEWRGLRNQNLQIKAGGIDDAVFVHAGGFIGGTISCDSAIKLARAWITKSDS